jgi:hypothetical protein
MKKRIRIKDYVKNIHISFPLSWIDLIVLKPYNITIFLDDSGEQIYKQNIHQKNESKIIDFGFKKVEELSIDIQLTEYDNELEQSKKT